MIAKKPARSLIRTAHSGWMPASLIILPHLPSWTLMWPRVPPASLRRPQSRPCRVFFGFRTVDDRPQRLVQQRDTSGGVPAGTTKAARSPCRSRSRRPRPWSAAREPERCVDARRRQGAQVARLDVLAARMVRSMNIIDTRPAIRSRRLWRALVGHVQHVDAGPVLERFAGDHEAGVLPLANDSLPGLALP